MNGIKRIIIKNMSKKYTLKELYDLWIIWGDQKNISFQKMFRIFKLDGSFVHWLELTELPRWSKTKHQLIIITYGLKTILNALKAIIRG